VENNGDWSSYWRGLINDTYDVNFMPPPTCSATGGTIFEFIRSADLASVLELGRCRYFRSVSVFGIFSVFVIPTSVSVSVF